MIWTDVRAPQVLPSLYAADLARLGEQARLLADAGVRVFHFDVGDGHFVAPITLGPIMLESLVPALDGRRAAFDAHLMVTNPVHHFEQLKAAGAASVTFHIETADDPHSTIAAARMLGLGVGVALNPGTPVQAAIAAAAEADLVLCMCIHPGYSGQAFMTESLERIAALRADLPDRVLVQVDGGIGPKTIAAAYEAGADLLVAGSAVFSAPDITAAYRRLTGTIRRRPCARRRAA